MDNKPGHFVEIKIPDTLFSGKYSNLAMVTHTKNEFILDFIFTDNNKAEIVSRIIMSPDHIKAFRNAIDQNISKYEKKLTENNTSTSDKSNYRK